MSSGQTINDRILAARFSIAGQGLAKSVCKATTEEVNGPKKKHLDYLLHCTNEPNVSIPQLANLLIERSQNTSWVVVFKALVTVHHLMCYGNERFTQFLASSNCNFQLGNFLDKSGVAGYDMSPFIRRYAKYLNEKALAYRTVAFDFCKVKRGKEDGTLRTMTTDKLLKTLPVLQSHLDALLEFDCSSNELTNGVINTAFMLLFRDLIRLFACYNDGIINLLEKYFDMNKKQCREALDIYKRFLVRMDRVAEFLKVAETVGVEKSDIPELSKAPSSLLEALEAHLASLEGKKPNSSSTTNVSAEIEAGMAALALASFAFSQVSLDTTLSASVTSSSLVPQPPSNSSAVGGANGETVPGIDENLKRQALAEEEAAMNQFKKNTNPFLSSPTTSNPPAQAPASTQAQTQSIVDLFAADIDAKAAQTNAPRTSDDLLQLAANPFAAPPIPPLPTMSAPAAAWGMNPMQNGYGAVPSGAFATDNAFAAAFGAPASSTTNAEGTQEGAGALDLFSLGAAMSSVESVPSVAHSPAPARPPAPAPASVAHITHVGAGDSSLDDFLCDWGTEPIANVGVQEAASVTPVHAPSAQAPKATTGSSAFADLSLENLLGSPAKKSSIAAPMTETIPVAVSSVTTMSADFTAGVAPLASNSPSKQAGKGFDAFGDLLQPNTNSNANVAVKPNHTAAAPTSTAAAGRVLTGDLDSCLASLAENLTIQKSPQSIPANKGMQWSNPGTGLPRQSIPNQGPSPQPQQWGTPMMPTQMGVAPGMQFMSMSQPTMPYQSAPMNMTMMGSVPMRPPQMMAPQGGMMFPTQQQPQAMGMSAPIRPVAASTQPLDPFGAL